MKKIILFVLCAVVMGGCSKEKVNAITIQEAQQTALNEVNGRLLKADEEKKGDLSYYDFTIVTDNEKYEIEVDANSGKIIKTEKDHDYVGMAPVSEGQAAPVDRTQTKITLEEAQQIALDYVKEGRIKKSELDFENDVAVFEIEIENDGKEYEISVNGTNGEIVKYEEDKND